MKSLSRAVAETYLKSQSISKGKFNKYSQIPVPPINQTEASTSSGEIPGTSTQTDQIPTSLADLLQSFSLNLFAATQTSNKIYEQVSEVGPKTSSTGFISEKVKAQEAHSQKKNKKPSQLREEVIWKLYNKWKSPEDKFISKQQPNKQQPNKDQ